MAKSNNFKQTTLEDRLDNQQEAINEKKDKGDIIKSFKSKERKKILKSIAQLNAELQCSNASKNNVESNANSDIIKSIVPRKSHKISNLKILKFRKTNREIQLVYCLGQLKYGVIAYSGVDIASGQQFYITEWQLEKSQIKEKHNKSGHYLRSNNTSTSHNSKGYIDSFIAKIENHVADLAQLEHKNLVHYKCVLCVKCKRSLTVFLVEEFIYGESISAMSAGGLVDWSMDGSRRVAQAVLHALVYLHEKGFVHGQLLNNNVLFGNARTICCTNYSIVPFLKQFMENSCCDTTEVSARADLIDLGKLVKSLISAKVDEVYDFIESCNKASCTYELLQHPFVNFHPEEVISSSISRFHTEFEMLQYLGSGAFGDVRKVRSTLDNRIYAIKRIVTVLESPTLFKKIAREIKLLSCLKHENVVRYYSSWAENAEVKDVHEIKAAFPHIGPFGNESFEDYSSFGETADNDAIANITYMHILHIQMEFCDKRTLRTAIEENLCENSQRVWNLFYGLDQGISHIHRHGIIHRDLKPENIFLDLHGNAKIGDFGMATTEFSIEKQQTFSLKDNIYATGKVGTSLYVAPELLGNASESYYNHKVDMYAFGIILFEMIYPNFTTIMERIKVLSALRSPEMVVPVSLLNNSRYEEFIKIIHLLLRHDPLQRPDTNHTEFLLLRQAALLKMISLNSKNCDNVST